VILVIQSGHVSSSYHNQKERLVIGIQHGYWALVESYRTSMESFFLPTVTGRFKNTRDGRFQNHPVNEYIFLIIFPDIDCKLNSSRFLQYACESGKVSLGSAAE
jgi:hypothetical protein